MTLKRVALAISSYRTDQNVLALLRGLREHEAPFGAVVVVDSQATGTLEAALRSQTWPWPLKCVSAAANLGSAGNLAERLRASGETGLDWAYALNHDGDLNPDAISALVEAGERADTTERPIGAVYPLRRLPNRGGTFDLTGRFPVPLMAMRTSAVPSASVVDVYWSSSNGALYALDPVRRGLLPWSDLWMGYEDLGYGWLLRRHGYRQILVPRIVVDDGYEYARRAGFWLTEKPSWYAYYHARNFLLVAERTEQSLPIRTAVLGRVLLELGITAAFRREKKKRLLLIARGIVDGMRNRTGRCEDI